MGIISISIQLCRHQSATDFSLIIAIIHIFYRLKLFTECVCVYCVYMCIILIYGYKCMHNVSEMTMLPMIQCNMGMRCSNLISLKHMNCMYIVQLYKQCSTYMYNVYTYMCAHLHTLYILCTFVLHEKRHNMAHILFLTSSDNLR